MAIAAGLTIFICVASLQAYSLYAPGFTDKGYADRSTHCKRSLARFDGKSPCRVMMMGSSKTQMGIATGPFEAALQEAFDFPVFAFNFAIAGEAPWAQMLHLHRLIQDGLTPDFLLLECTPLFLSSKMSPSSEYWLLEDDVERQLLSKAGVDLKRSQTVDLLHPHWYDKRHLLVAKARRRWNPRNLDFNTSPEHDRFGDILRVNDCTLPVDQIAEQISGYGPGCADLTLGGVNYLCLKQSLAMAHQAGIPCALVIMPEGKMFQDLYSPKSRAVMASLVQEINATWNVPLIDARLWMPEESHYIDSHHMTRAGSVHFAERLAKEGVIPWMKKVESTSPRENPFRTTSR